MNPKIWLLPCNHRPHFNKQTHLVFPKSKPRQNHLSRHLAIQSSLLLPDSLVYWSYRMTIHLISDDKVPTIVFCCHGKTTRNHKETQVDINLSWWLTCLSPLLIGAYSFAKEPEKCAKMFHTSLNLILGREMFIDWIRWSCDSSVNSFFFVEMYVSVWANGFHVQLHKLKWKLEILFSRRSKRLFTYNTWWMLQFQTEKKRSSNTFLPCNLKAFNRMTTFSFKHTARWVVCLGFMVYQPI